MPENGVLFIVPTPIGNLEDMTFRGIRVLKESTLIAAEDTRHTKKLLMHYNINTPTISYFEHNRFTRIPQILDHLMSGKNIAVVTDAGTPGISDPAYKLIRATIENHIKVESIPGASASVTALSASGLPTDRFLFEGFLPHRKGRRKKLERLANLEATIIFYESPMRLIRTLNDILEFIGDRPAVIGRELTKVHEEYQRGKVSELINYFKENKPRGEFVVMIGKDDKNVYF
ncbi:MAG: 16S rRNA (cytidine(1402)-2'-O)-methyltransferase [Candidatus Marinimicrobia bacterium]|jgi:16S rRNA (cytidine1402-2'-O)-methyltransferase|nr:16S rRNA (cytidine(1402)-2'-O)-methyltransferase [Candidatus Neomarinimicrobiota bacterium]